MSRLTDAVPFETWAKGNFENKLRAPESVVRQAESGLRQFRAAINSAPDYGKIAGSVLSVANSELSNLREAWLPTVEESARKAEGGLRQLRAAYRAAPDYAKIASSVLASWTVAEDAADADDDDAFFGGLGFALQAPEPLRTVARQMPFWKEASASAIPDYGSIAATVDYRHADSDEHMTGFF